MRFFSDSGSRETGFRLALHIDVALLTYNRIRQERAGSGPQANAGRLREVARRSCAVELFPRHSARDRVATDAAVAK